MAAGGDVPRQLALLLDDWLTETEYCNMRDEISLKHDEVAIAENDTCLLRFVKDLQNKGPHLVPEDCKKNNLGSDDLDTSKDLLEEQIDYI